MMKEDCMLSEHGLILLNNPPFRCKYSRYHDINYALSHFDNDVSIHRLHVICKTELGRIRKILKRADGIGHVEYEERKGYRITEKGIEYNKFWFAIQHRFDIMDIVPSAFKIHDVSYDEELIKLLMDNISNIDPRKKPCYKLHRGTRRDYLNRYLDALRYLKKHREVIISAIRNSVNIGDEYERFEEDALSRGHIRFSEGKTSRKGKPCIKATSKGLALLRAVNWIVTECDLGDYVPSIIG